jgi:hypothetical protein
MRIFWFKTRSIPNGRSLRDRLAAMPRYRLLPGIAGFALLLQVAACGAPEHEELRGSLYFAAGNYLALLDLRDGSTSVVANLGDADIRSLSPQLEDRLLLTVYGNENNRETRNLVLYDLASRQTLTLLNGHIGYYLPGTMTLVFDDGARIYVTEPIQGDWEKTEVIEHRYNQGVDIVPIAATRFIYRVADGPLYVYDQVAGRSIELRGLGSTCRFERALWFAEREQMLCQLRHEGESMQYAFVGLDGTVHEDVSLPSSRDLRPLAFLPDQDVLILTERWRGGLADRVRWAVWVYRFDSGEAYRLLDDQHLGEHVSYARD